MHDHVKSFLDQLSRDLRRDELWKKIVTEMRYYARDLMRWSDDGGRS